VHAQLRTITNLAKQPRTNGATSSGLKVQCIVVFLGYVTYRRMKVDYSLST